MLQVWVSGWFEFLELKSIQFIITSLKISYWYYSNNVMSCFEWMKTLKWNSRSAPLNFFCLMPVWCLFDACAELHSWRGISFIILYNSLCSVSSFSSHYLTCQNLKLVWDTPNAQCITVFMHSIFCNINWVARALNSDLLTAMVYETVYHVYDKMCIFTALILLETSL